MVFEDNENDPQHLKQALPASTISKLIKPNAAIKSVTQPYASFGGQMKEESNSFYTRVSERLRLKRGLFPYGIMSGCCYSTFHLYIK
jgi:hypothetical protein